MANHGGMRLTAALCIPHMIHCILVQERESIRTSSRDLNVLVLGTDSPRSGAENEFHDDLRLISSSRTLDETSLNSELNSRKSCQ